MAFTASSLRRGLNTLPQEIFDMIYNEVFTAPFAAVRDLDDTSTRRASCKLLQISRDSRAQYAASYYNTALIYSNTKDPMARICGLPKTHRALLRRVTYCGDDRDDEHHTTEPGLLPECVSKYIVDSLGAETAAKYFVRSGSSVYGVSRPF